MNRQQQITTSLVAVALAMVPSLGMGEESGTGGVGFYTAVSGTVRVTHPGESRLLPVKLNDDVLFKDVIETQQESRTKAFFEDDSVLTVGENSRVEISEYIYNPEAKMRRSVVKVLQGQVRALVSKVFKSNGSRFEVHTPSAVAAARGTYFVVWHENGQSGIINVGESGRVDFTSGGVTVPVDPGQFSLAEQGKPPSTPAIHGLDNARNAQVLKTNANRGLERALKAVEKTMLRDTPPADLPTRALRAVDVEAHVAKAHATLTRVADGQQGNGNADGQTGGNGNGNGNAFGVNGGNGNGNVYGLNGGNGVGNAFGLGGGPVTPPAVMTGAGNAVGNGNGNGGVGGGGNGHGNGYGRRP